MFNGFSLIQDKSIYLSKGNRINYLLEGDNLCSLKALQTIHKNRVDIIYIDPPYNTKRKTFLYTDRIGSHSDYIEFMRPRLLLGSELLTRDGVIFISIDDNEQAYLKVLCDEIFGDDNFISQIVWKKSSARKNDTKLLSNDLEYILVYAKDKKLVNFRKNISQRAGYKLEDEYLETRGRYLLNNLDRQNLTYEAPMDFVIEMPNGQFVYAGGSKDKYENRRAGKANYKDWRFIWSEAKVKWGIENGFIIFKQNKDGVWRAYNKQYEKVDNTGEPYERVVPFSNFIDFVTTKKGSMELNDILGKNSFLYAKSVELIKYLIKLVDKKELVVLDFFAGSGTTGQAVLELNQEDDVDRQFILCTNNENNICEDITYERLRTVLLGVRRDGSLYNKGMNGNLEYWRYSLEV